MEIRIDGACYTSLAALPASLPLAVRDFLAEWFSPQPYVMGHTSGSTGTPQPLQLAKADMVASAQITNNTLGITAHSHLLLCLSPQYIAGKMIIVRALTAGAMLHVVSPSSTPLTKLTCPIDLAAMVPMQVEATLRRPDGARRLSHIATLLVGGAPLTPSLEQRLAALPVVTFVTYGMTETVSHVALRRITEPHYTALGDVTFTTDARGCLVIEAPHLAQRRYVTNDVVQLLSPRTFTWLGRYDNVIISGGLKFSPESIEAKIAPHLARNFYLVGAPDDLLGRRIVLVIEGTPLDDEALAALHRALATSLSRYELPREVRFMPQLARTYSGKIKRLLP